MSEEDPGATRHVAVLGAGAMGLACAYRLQQLGHRVTVLEAAPRIGGMAVFFDFDGLDIERYYHFICKPDQPLFDLLGELGIADKLRWVQTRMGFYYQGTMYEWGRPDLLLRFPRLGMISKLRYAANLMYCKSVGDWTELDKLESRAWLKKWIGEKAYDVFWRPLIDLKFYQYADDLSAAWMAARVQRVARSRKSLWQEELGHLDGGSEVLIEALAAAIRQNGGEIRVSAPARRVRVEHGRVTGVELPDGALDCDAVLSTVPLPYVTRLAPDLTEAERAHIDGIDNIPVACVILKLRHAISPYFWTNINDPRIPLPGVIEYSNLNDPGAHILYAPYYVPRDNPVYQRSDEELLREVKGCLKLLNPEYEDDWVLAGTVSRYEYAQTICTSNFYARIPPMQTSIEGFLMADTSYYYPEDRSISESVRVGRELAEALGAAG